jgi:hypothetical protein
LFVLLLWLEKKTPFHLSDFIILNAIDQFWISDPMGWSVWYWESLVAQDAKINLRTKKYFFPPSGVIRISDQGQAGQSIFFGNEINR